MNYFLKQILYGFAKVITERLKHIRPSERGLVVWSFLYFFFLLSGYFVLRPLRDEMGILNGASNMQWLFTGTFIAMLLLVPVFGYITKKIPINKFLSGAYVFFILNILLFYLSFSGLGPSRILAIIFFIWLSVFNLFLVSLFWSFMVDIFSSEQAVRLFGTIAAGGSIGALSGPLVTSYLTPLAGLENLFLIAALFLMFALGTLLKIIKLKKGHSFSSLATFEREVDGPQPSLFVGAKRTFSSAYLMGIVLFIMCYTAIATFLYFEQAHILENTVELSSERVIYFSRIDLLTNSLAIGGQLLLTHRIIRSFGLALALLAIPFLVGIGFLVLSYELTLTVVATTMVLHRAGNFSVLKPGREMLFTITTREEKYKAKNFIDTAVYRGGDALTGWVFTIFIAIGFGLGTIALLAVPIAIIWGLTGYILGRKHHVKEKSILNQEL